MKAAHVFHWASICLSIMLCLTWSNLNTFSFISKYLLRNLLFITYVTTPALFVHFTLVFPRENSFKWRKLLAINYLIAFLLAVINIYAFVYTLSDFSDGSIDNYLNAFNLLRIYLIINVIFSISFFACSQISIIFW